MLQRQHWVPYFDDSESRSTFNNNPVSLFALVQAIIFLAPLAFNQVLEEDSRVNRLVIQILQDLTTFSPAFRKILSACGKKFALAPSWLILLWSCFSIRYTPILVLQFSKITNCGAIVRWISWRRTSKLELAFRDTCRVMALPLMILNMSLSVSAVLSTQLLLLAPELTCTFPQISGKSSEHIRFVILPCITNASHFQPSFDSWLTATFLSTEASFAQTATFFLSRNVRYRECLWCNLFNCIHCTYAICPPSGYTSNFGDTNGR